MPTAAMLADVGLRAWLALVLAVLAVASTTAAIVWVRRAGALQRAAEERAGIDVLTGLPDRDRAHDQLAAAAGSGRGAVWLIELDRFETVNERHGHDTGDRLLRRMAERMATVVGPGERLHRWSGPQLVVVTHERLDDATVAERATALRDPLTARVRVGHDTIQLSASVVGRSLTDAPEDPDEIVAGLRATLGRARGDGWGVVGVHDPDRDRPSDGRALSDLVRTALDDGSVTIRYRPVVHLGDLAVGGLEAVPVWVHPSGRELEGVELTAAVEEAGAGVDYSWLVLRDAASRVEAWRRDHPELDLVVMVSVFPELVAGQRQRLERWLEDLADPEGLCVSLLATARRNPTAIWGGLNALRERGVQVGLSHFGAGWASVEYLRQLSVSVLSLDAGLVAHVRTAREDQGIIQQVVGMAHELGVIVVADGITDQAQGEAVAAVGADLGTGPGLGRPVDPADVQPILHRGRIRWSGTVPTA